MIIYHLLYIVFTLLSGLIFAYIFLKYKSGWVKSKFKIEKSLTSETLESLLKALPCKFKKTKDNNDDLYSFDYQGGHFLVFISPDSPYVKIQYLFFFSTPVDNASIVRTVCNHLNVNTLASKLVYSIDEKDNNVDVHIITGTIITNEIKEMLGYFEAFLSNIFELQRYFIKEFDGMMAEKKKSGVDDYEISNFTRQREIFLLREQELQQQNENNQWRVNDTSKLTLGQMLDALYDMRDYIFMKLNVITDELAMLTDDKEIRDLDIMGLLLKKTGEGVVTCLHTNANLVLMYDNPQVKVKSLPRTIMVDLRYEGEANSSFYIRVTISQSPVNISRYNAMRYPHNQPQLRSFLVAYDKAGSEQKLAEFRYIWQDAKDKAGAGKLNELTEEQSLIFDCVVPKFGYNIYWGLRLFHNKRYYESLLHLENAYYFISLNYDNGTKSLKSQFYEICYYIGFCYCELRQYQRAYFYLSIVFPQNVVKYTECYINCLVNSRDYRAMDLLDDLLLHVQKRINEDEGSLDTNLISFINFLRRRQAAVFVDLGKYDKAESLCTAMLEEPENKDYALDELAYIQKIRKERKGDS